MKLILLLLFISCAKIKNIFFSQKEKILESELKNNYDREKFYHFDHPIFYLEYLEKNFQEKKGTTFFESYTVMNKLHRLVLEKNIDGLKEELNKQEYYIPNQNNWNDRHDFNPLEYAAYFGYYDIFKLLFEKMPNLINNPERNPRVINLIAINSENIDEKLKILNLLLKRNKNSLEVKDPVGHNALMYAAIFNNIEMFKTIYNKGNNLLLEETNLFMNTLDYLGMYGNLEIYKYLLEEKAVDINKKDSKGRTAFMIACSNNREEFINYCISKNVNVLETDNDGRASIAYITRYGYLELFNKINEITKEKSTKEEYQKHLLISLFDCIKAEKVSVPSEAIMKLIIANIDNINSTLKIKQEELTPLLYALKKGKRKSIELIIESKEIDLLKKKAFKYENIVEAAVAKNQLEALKLFFNKLENEKKVNIELIKKLQKALKEAESSEDEGYSSDEYLEMENFLLKEVKVYSKNDQ